MADETTIYRYEVPVDGEVHTFQCSPPLFVASRQSGVVEFWAYPDGSHAWSRAFMIIGTGHPLPVVAEGGRVAYHSSTLDGPFVWHLLEVPS